MYSILCFGDSNTYGEKASGGRFARDERWTGILQELLGEDYYIIEEGLGGRTTLFDDEIEEYKNGKKYLIPCLNSHKPLDLVILMLGTNDLKNRFALSPLDIEFAMENLVKTIKSTDCFYNQKSKEILIISPIAIGKLTLLKDILMGAVEKSKELPVHYERLCIRENIHFMNAGDFAKPDEQDGIHLDSLGHRNLANAIAAKIKSILNEEK